MPSHTEEERKKREKEASAKFQEEAEETEGAPKQAVIDATVEQLAVCAGAMKSAGEAINMPVSIAL